MAVYVWRGDAAPRAAVWTVTPANPEPGDQFILTINRKPITVTAEDTTAAGVVALLKAAIEESTIPEWQEVSVDETEDGAAALTITGPADGTPVEITATTSNAGSFGVSVEQLLAGVADQNEKQQVRLPTGTSGGTFTLTFEGQTTAAIAYNAAAATVQTALEALSNIAVGDVEVTGSAGGPWTVEFKLAFAGKNVALLIGDGTSLTGAGNVTVTTYVQGQPKVNEIQTITGLVLAAGNLRLSFTDPWGQVAYTGLLLISAYDTTNALLIQAALEALANIGPGNVQVTAITDGFQVEFVGALGGRDVSLLEAMQGTATIATTQAGTASGVNEKQYIRLGGALGGHYHLTFEGQTTAEIAYNASAATIDTALEALSNIGAGNVTVTEPSTGTFLVEFTGSLAAKDVGEITVDNSALTGGPVYVTVTQLAVTGRNEQQSVTITGGASGGHFHLTYGGNTTAALDWDATAAEVDTALEALAGIGAGGVSAAGPDGGPWTVEFTGSLAKTAVALMTSDATALTGSGTQSLTILQTVTPTGPNWYNEADNWDQHAVPPTGADVDFSQSSAECKYGLTMHSQKTVESVNAGTDTITITGHSWSDTRRVQLTSTGSLPTPLQPATWYYVRDSAADTFKLAATSGGAAIDLTDAGTGTISIGTPATPALFRAKASYTGKIGLAAWNELGYWEYRSRYLALGDVTDAATVTIWIGEGEGSGSGRINLDSGPCQAAMNLLGSGTASESDLPAVQWIGTHASNVVRIKAGSLGAALSPAETAVIATLDIGYLENVESDSQVTLGPEVVVTTITKSGGVLVAMAESGTAITTLTQEAGETTIYGTDALTTLNLHGGTVWYCSTGALGTAHVGGDGVLDFSRDARAKTVTNPIEVYSEPENAAGAVVDPNKVVSSLVIDYNRTTPNAKLGTNLRLTRGAVA